MNKHEISDVNKDAILAKQKELLLALGFS